MYADPSTLPSLYRETIRYAASGERKYIRYFDGRGHFGHVRLQLKPQPGEACSISVDASCHLPKRAAPLSILLCVVDSIMALLDACRLLAWRCD